MIVVSDTSPLNYLVLIEQIEVIRTLYGGVALPQAVREEMTRCESPLAVRSWASQLPSWVELYTVNVTESLVSEKLDTGERESIALALSLQSPALIIDETAGRKEAKLRGLRVIGTLGILREADALGVLDLREAIERLQQTSFRIASATLASFLAEQ